MPGVIALMKLRSKIKIQATPETIWALVTEPEFIQQWNSKLIAYEAESDEPKGRYRFTFRMSQKETPCAAMILASTYPEELTWEFSSATEKGTHWEIQDHYKLSAKGDGTQLSRIVDLSGAPIPTWVKPIIWFIMTFGQPVDTPHLEQLRRLAEDL